MKITLPEVWGCEDPAADESLTRYAFMFVKQWNRGQDIEEKLEAIVSYFAYYENVYGKSYAKKAMKIEVAFNVMHFARDIAETIGITEDVVLGLWNKVFRRDIWEFTGKYSPYSKNSSTLKRT